MASLSTMPVDIYLHMLKFLRTPDLYSLNLVCKPLRELTEPALYRTIHLSWRDLTEIESTDARWNDKGRRLLRNVKSGPFRLLRSILGRPELASLVRSIQFTFDDRSSDVDHHRLNTRSRRRHSYDRPPSWRDFKALNEVVLKEDLLDKIMWRTELSQGAIDAYVALLLHHLHNLEYLNLGTGFLRASSFTDLTMRHNLIWNPEASSLRPFKSIKHIVYNAEQPGSNHPPTIDDYPTMVALFYLPSVETMEIALPDCSGIPKSATGRIASTLRVLIVHRALVRALTLERVLSFAPNLTSLILELSYLGQGPLSLHDGPENINCPEVWHVLLRLEPSLECLVLYVIPCMPQENRQIHLMPPLPQPPQQPHWAAFISHFGSLRGFKKLKKLDVPLIMLLGGHELRYQEPTILAECLPTNLEDLSLSYTEDTFTKFDNYIVHNFHLHLSNYLQQSRELSSSLLSITVKLGEWDSAQRSLIGISALADLCEWFGVALRVIQNVADTRYSNGDDMVRKETLFDPLEPAPGPTVSYKWRTFLEHGPRPVRTPPANTR
ncbi:hypothetical protein BU16DRAFT_528583 [Lophium mytilinum]|uniref:F-box domain-containing protein n=1 Tax=Lophium mytilinum TaxID=390894 RepID=A0A6A6QQZ4_9PEZI|nr:hypothetical protein BU16DRAFT_528583 [Lophium mytilinum]